MANYKLLILIKIKIELKSAMLQVSNSKSKIVKKAPSARNHK